MGSLSAAYHDPYNVNIVNPASLPHLLATSFEVGINAKYNRLSEGTKDFTSWNGNLTYFSLAFPLSNPINDLLDRVDRKYQLGMSISLQPNTTVGYEILTVGASNGITGIERNYIGNGGTYTGMWGTGLKVKDFSVGVNLGYMFGKIGTNKTVKFLNNEAAFDNYERIDQHITGFIYNLGMQYDIILNKEEVAEDVSKTKKVLTVGLYGNSPTNFNTSTDELFMILRDAVSSLPSDTLVDEREVAGTGKLPAKLGVGFMYQGVIKKNKETKKDGVFAIGVNYEMQNWSGYENDQNPIALNNSFKLSAGGFFTPDPAAFNYFQRIQYKFGIFYSQEPFSVQDEDVLSYGFTTGFGLPFVNSRKVSNANIGATLGTRGINTVIEERYLRLNFGFTFNSTEWFRKRKYN